MDWGREWCGVAGVVALLVWIRWVCAGGMERVLLAVLTLSGKSRGLKVTQVFPEDGEWDV